MKKFTLDQVKRITLERTNNEVEFVDTQYNGSFKKSLFKDKVGIFSALPYNVWAGSRNPKTVKGKYISCRICKKQTYAMPNALNIKKYCSYTCKSKSQETAVFKKCKWCGNEYKAYLSQIKHRGSNYCSKECQSKGQGKERKGKIISSLWTMRHADKVFSDYIRQRDNLACRGCNKQFDIKSGVLTNSHFWGRTRMSTRFEEKNCIALCWPCHIYRFEKEKQGRYMQLMIEWLGEEDYAKLSIQSQQFKSKKEAIKNLMTWIEPKLQSLTK